MKSQLQLVLCLHGIGEPHKRVNPDERPYWISRCAFISLLEIIAERDNEGRLPVLITFDDGNSSDALIALPELAKRKLQAIFFVVGDRIDAPNYLDPAALKELVSAGMEVGCHGMHHNDWRSLDRTALHVEIDAARRRLEDICGTAVTKVGIPFGSYDRNVLKQLRAECLAAVFTSDGGLARSDAWLKPRRTISYNDSHADLKSLITQYPGLATYLWCRAATMYKSIRPRHSDYAFL